MSYFIKLIKASAFYFSLFLKVLAVSLIAILIAVFLSYSIAPVINAMFADFMANFGFDYWSARFWCDLPTTILAFFVGGLVALRLGGRSGLYAAAMVAAMGLALHFNGFKEKYLFDEHAWQHRLQLLSHFVGVISAIVFTRRRQWATYDQSLKPMSGRRRETGINLLFFVLGVPVFIGGLYVYQLFAESEYDRLHAVAKEVAHFMPTQKAREALKKVRFAYVKETASPLDGEAIDPAYANFNKNREFKIKSEFFFGSVGCSIRYDELETLKEYDCFTAGVPGLLGFD